MPDYFDRYIDLNEDIELNVAFDNSIIQIDHLDIIQLKRIGTKTYAEGKWSINKIIQHLTDWERIWCYRTILAVRNEGTIPSGHDHVIMANNANADEITIEQLIAELRLVRLATIAIFKTFNNDLLMSNCKFFNNQMSFLAMGFNIIGHQLHHFNVIRAKYLQLD